MMFDFLKKKKMIVNPLRETLFGDIPIDFWSKTTTEPWISFNHVKESLKNENKKQAIDILHRITTTENLESRHYLQAWFFLRQLGEKPDICEDE